VIPREVTWKGEVSVGIGISPLVTKDSSFVMGDVSSMLEEDIRIETLGEVRGKSSSRGSQMGFQRIS